MSPDHQQLYRARYMLYRRHGMNIASAYRSIRIRVSELMGTGQPANIPSEVLALIQDLHGNH